MSEQRTPVASPPTQPTHSQTEPSAATRRRRSPWLILLGLIVIVGGAGMYFYEVEGGKKDKEGNKDTPASSTSQTGDSGDEAAANLTMKVEVTHPKGGGLGRVTNQPADVHAFQFAELRRASRASWTPNRLTSATPLKRVKPSP